MAWQQQQAYTASQRSLTSQQQQYQRQQHPNYQQYQQAYNKLTPQQQQAYNAQLQLQRQQQYNQYYANQSQGQQQYAPHQQRLMNAYQSSAPPVASPFLQAQQQQQQQMRAQQAAAQQQQQWSASQRQMQPGAGSDIKLIADQTPPSSDDESNAIPGQQYGAQGAQQYNNYQQQYSNMVTAQQRMQQLIASQQKMIDQFRKNEANLRKQLGERDTHWRKTLNDSLNKKDLRIGELFEETLKLQEQSKQEQMKNVELKQVIMRLRSESSRLMFSSRKLPGAPSAQGIPPPPAPDKSVSIPEEHEVEEQKTTAEKTKVDNNKQDAIETESKSKDHKKNALNALFGARKPQETTSKSTKSETDCAGTVNLKLAKYEKMKKLNMPMQTILNKMKMDGVDKELIAEFKGEKKSKKKKKEESALAKYVKMKKIGMPMVSIINKMRMDGVDKALIAAFNGETKDDEEEEEDSGAKIDLNDPKFDKYKKMKKLSMPSNSIINKMRMDGLSKEEIDAFTGNGVVGKKKKKKKDKRTQMQELAMAMGLKPKEAVAPNKVKKLKRIHWTVIDLKDIKGTFWEEINKKYDDDNEMELGAKFELEFQIRQRKPRLMKNKSRMMSMNLSFGGRNESRARGKKDRITWIGGKRDQNIQIGLKTMGLNNEQIYDAIVDMDDDAMTLKRLETIFELTPNIEEQRKAEEKIDALGDEVQFCGPSELFHIEMSSIPEVRQQVTKWLFCGTFNELYMDRLQQVTNIIRGCYAIKESRALKMYLRVLLQMGNLMNHGIADKSCAYGFDLVSLGLLDNIKNFAGNKTLAMFLYEYAYNRYPEVRGFEEELAVLKVAVRTESNAIEQSIKQMADEFLNIDLFCRRLHDEYHPGDTQAFREYMKTFSDSQSMKMMNLKVKVQNAQSIANNVASYYGIPLDEGKPESLFKTVQKFVDIMEKARRALIKMEKERQKLAAKKAKERERAKKKKEQGKLGKMKLTVSQMMSRKKKEKAEEEEKGNLLFHDIKNAAAKFSQRQQKMEKRLSVQFNEKIAISKGEMTESMQSDPIKKRLSQQIGVEPLVTIQEAEKLRKEDQDDADAGDEIDDEEMNKRLKLQQGVGSNNLMVPASPI